MTASCTHCQDLAMCRRKVLEAEMSSMKEKVAVVLEKSLNDSKLISALRAEVATAGQRSSKRYVWEGSCPCLKIPLVWYVWEGMCGRSQVCVGGMCENVAVVLEKSLDDS